MRDAILRAGWHCSVLTMILAAALIGLALSYRALFALIAGAWDSSMSLLTVAAFAAAAVKWLCDNREDLVS